MLREFVEQKHYKFAAEANVLNFVSLIYFHDI